MTKSLEMLSEEHKNILQVIDAVFKECDELEKGKKLDVDFFKETIGFIRGYADKFHHAKEEDILFRELSKDDVEMHCNPMQQMLYEHDMGRGFVKDLKLGVELKDASAVIKNARAYGHLLQDHIFKEENILYPMANEILSSSVKDNMLKEFYDVDKRLAKEKEKYLSFVASLKNR